MGVEKLSNLAVKVFVACVWFEFIFAEQLALCIQEVLSSKLVVSASCWYLAHLSCFWNCLKTKWVLLNFT